MDHLGLHGRFRDENGEISRKHGNTLVRTLRKIYGNSFVRGFDGDDKLRDVLHAMDDESLSHLMKDHEAGELHSKIIGNG